MAPARETASDLIEELRLRRWARENYVAAEHRDPCWSAIVLHEMRCKDAELEQSAWHAPTGLRAVPLIPDTGWRLHEAHVELEPPLVLLRLPAIV